MPVATLALMKFLRVNFAMRFPVYGFPFRAPEPIGSYRIRVVHNDVKRLARQSDDTIPRRATGVRPKSFLRLAIVVL
jgi:hypothetical protein